MKALLITDQPQGLKIFHDSGAFKYQAACMRKPHQKKALSLFVI